MKNILIALCWLVSLGVLSLHAESSHTTSGEELSARDAATLPTATSSGNARADRSPPQRFAALNFSAPLHLPGQKPATGTGSIMPAGLSGNPQVVAATPVLQHQPLILNSDLVNGPCCYEEGIQVLVREEAHHYAISFDLVTQQLADSFNQFQLWLNDDDAPLLRFQADHLLVLDGVGAIAGFREDQLLHVHIHLDLPAQQLAIAINGEELYRGERALKHLQALQFLMTIEGGATPEQVNPEARVALDNIVVGNGGYQYANLQTAVQRSRTSEGGQGRIEFVASVNNISAHGARDVVLTHLLPPGVSVAAVDSAALACEVVQNQVICRAEQLNAMARAEVNLVLTAASDLADAELTVIASSTTEEIDNRDNQVRARFGGSGSLLLLVALLALWFMRPHSDIR